MWLPSKRRTSAIAGWSDDEDEAELWGHHRVAAQSGKELQRQRRSTSMRRCLALGLFCGVGAAVTFTLGAILIALPRMFEVQQSLLQEQTPQAHYTTPAMLYSEQGGLPLSGLSRELSRALGLGQGIFAGDPTTQHLLRPGLAATYIPPSTATLAPAAAASAPAASATTAAAASRVQPSFSLAARCFDWCATHTTDGAPTSWAERCAWETLACSACAQCAGRPAGATAANSGAALSSAARFAPAAEAQASTRDTEPARPSAAAIAAVYGLGATPSGNPRAASAALQPAASLSVTSLSATSAQSGDTPRGLAPPAATDAATRPAPRAHTCTE